MLQIYQVIEKSRGSRLSRSGSVKVRCAIYHFTVQLFLHLFILINAQVELKLFRFRHKRFKLLYSVCIEINKRMLLLFFCVYFAFLQALPPKDEGRELSLENKDSELSWKKGLPSVTRLDSVKEEEEKPSISKP